MRGQTWQVATSCTAAGDVAVKAAISGATHYVTKIIITIFLHQAAGTLALTDGTTTYFKWLAKDANGTNIELTFDPNHAFSWGTGKAITLTVAVADVDANIVVMGFTAY